MSDDLRDTIAGAIAEEHHRRARELIEASPELDRLRADLRWARSELAKADAENNANGRRVDQADATLERARHLVDEALQAWKPEHDYHQERATRKGYTHDMAAAEVYGRAIEALTEVLVVLGQPGGDFAEDDEPIETIREAFEQGEKGATAPPVRGWNETLWINQPAKEGE